MAIIVSGIRAKDKPSAINTALKSIGISESSVKRCEICKVSKDARHKNLSFVFSVYAEFFDEDAENAAAEKYSFVNPVPKSVPYSPSGFVPLSYPPVVVGTGPAGLFAALELARHGYRPVVLERGSDMDKRTEICEDFFTGGQFTPRTNVQFGEGGAGTFSDGKLTTRIGDSLCRDVLMTFSKFGAGDDILYEGKPHIGTDKLRDTIKNIREEIIRLGGKVYFENMLTDITLKDNGIVSVTTEKGTFPCGVLIMATGHSARDTFRMLSSKGTAMECKPFSVGLRIEHKREDINRAMYGENYDKSLFGEADYNLSLRRGNRAVYTFCMCPGGVCIPAASEEDGTVVNGMSYKDRSEENSNSALVVSVSAEDFGGGIFSGVEFQRKIETKAYISGGKNHIAPVESVGDFMGTGGKMTVTPSYSRGVRETDLSVLFPDFVNSMLRSGISEFGKKIKGFSDSGAVLTGVETRTSSPIRILRKENHESLNIKGLFPCGEGAGYAGGIMSAAVDGIKTARAVMDIYKA